MKTGMLKRLLAVVSGILENVTIAIYIIMLVLGASQVFLRYVVGWSIFWAEEVSTYCFVYLVFLGASLATRSNEHPYVDFLVVGLGARFIPLFNAFRDASMLVYAAVLAIEGFTLVRLTPSLTPALQFPYRFVYLSMPIGSLFIGMYSLIRLVQDLLVPVGSSREGDA
jgi:TRAP-type C4-dicarboxylate transport system permease small subunit